MDIQVYRKLIGRDCSEKSAAGYAFSMADAGFPTDGSIPVGVVRAGDTSSTAPVVEIQAYAPSKWVLFYSYTVKSIKGRAVRAFSYMYSLFFQGGEDAALARRALAALTHYRGVSINPDRYYDLCCDSGKWGEIQTTLPLDALEDGQAAALRHAPCPSVSQEELAMLYAAVWKACWLRIQQLRRPRGAEADDRQKAYAPVEVNLLSPDTPPELALDSILRFMNDVFLPGLPACMLPLLSVTLGTSYRNEVTQPNSAAYFLINDGAHAAALDFYAGAVAPQGADVAYIASMLQSGALPAYFTQIKQSLRRILGQPFAQSAWAPLDGDFYLYVLAHDLACALDARAYTRQENERTSQLLNDIMLELVKALGVELQRARAALLPLEERYIRREMAGGHLRTLRQYEVLLARLQSIEKAAEFIDGAAYTAFCDVCLAALQTPAAFEGSELLPVDVLMDKELPCAREAELALLTREAAAPARLAGTAQGQAYIRRVKRYLLTKDTSIAQAARDALHRFILPDGTARLQWYFVAQEKIEESHALGDSQDRMRELCALELADALARDDLTIDGLCALCRSFQSAFAKYKRLREGVWPQLYDLLLLTGRRAVRTCKECQSFYEALLGFMPLPGHQTVALIQVLDNLRQAPLSDDCLAACSRLLDKTQPDGKAAAFEAYRDVLARRMLSEACDREESTRQYCQAADENMRTEAFLDALEQCFRSRYAASVPPAVALDTAASLLCARGDMLKLLPSFAKYAASLPLRLDAPPFISQDTARMLAFITKLIARILDMDKREEASQTLQAKNWAFCYKNYLRDRLLGALPQTPSIDALLHYAQSNQPAWAKPELWNIAVKVNEKQARKDIDAIFRNGRAAEMSTISDAESMLDQCRKHAGTQRCAPELDRLILAGCKETIIQSADIYYNQARSGAQAMQAFSRLLDSLKGEGGKQPVQDGVWQTVHNTSKCIAYINDTLTGGGAAKDWSAFASTVNDMRHTENIETLTAMLRQSFEQQFCEFAGHPYARYSAAFLCCILPQRQVCDWASFLRLCFPQVETWDTSDAWRLHDNTLPAINSLLSWMKPRGGGFSEGEGKSLLAYLQENCPRLTKLARRKRKRRAAFKPYYQGGKFQFEQARKDLPPGVLKLYFDL